MSRNGNKYTVELPDELIINHVVIEENVEEGDKIDQFTVYVYPTHFGKPVIVYRGETVGHRHICSFPTVCTQKLEIVVEKERAPHSLESIKVHYIEK